MSSCMTQSLYIYPEECLSFIIIEIIKNMLVSWTDDQAKSHSILFLEEIQSLNAIDLVLHI